MKIVWFAVVDVAAHDGRITSRRDEDSWPDHESGWTYQEVTGAHGTVLYEGPSEAKARAELATWLQCDSASRGTYCYTHNPHRG